MSGASYKIETECHCAPGDAYACQIHSKDPAIRAAAWQLRCEKAESAGALRCNNPDHHSNCPGRFSTCGLVPPSSSQPRPALMCRGCDAPIPVPSDLHTCLTTKNQWVTCDAWKDHSDGDKPVVHARSSECVNPKEVTK